MSNLSQHVGIDVGKSSLFVSIADSGSPKKFPVHVFKYEDPQWHHHFLKLIDPHALVCAEPTGWHYFAPIVQAFSLRPVSPTIVQVNNATTGDVRRTYISKAKNDKLDAQALAKIAQLIATGEDLRGIKPYLHAHTTAANLLRIQVNEMRRLKKERTRALNRIDQLAHSIFPQLAMKKSTWLNAVALGAIDGQDLHDLIAEQYVIPAQQRRFILKLAEQVPAVIAESGVKQAITRQHQRIEALNNEIATIEAQLSHDIEQPPFTDVTSAWRTVPAINDTHIAAFHIATNGQADTYNRSEFKSAVGVAPTTGISGSVDKTSKSNGGYRPATDALFLMSITLLNPKMADNPIRDYRNRGKSGAACRRKLADMLSGIARNKQPYFYKKGNSS